MDDHPYATPGMRLRLVAASFGLAAVATVVFSSAARLPFVSDDYSYLETVRQPGWWHAESVWNPRGSPFNHLYRPMLSVWFGLLYHTVGLHPLPFHVATGVLVIVAGVMTAAVGRRLGLRSGAYAAAVVYCLHASMATPVGWTSAASSPLATALALGSVYLLLGRRLRAREIAASSVLFVLALMTREVVAVTPALVVLCVCAVDEGRPWLTRVRRSLIVSLPLWLVLVAYATVRRASGFDSTLGAYQQRIGTHAFTNLWRLMRYATEFGLSNRLGALVAAFWIVLIGLCISAAVRTRLPQGLVGVAWAFFGVLPVIFLTRHAMDYYYLDFALPGVALAAGTVFQWIFETSSQNMRLAAAATCVAGLAALGFYTARQEEHTYLAKRAPVYTAVIAYVTRHNPDPAKGSTIRLPITAAQATYGSYPNLVRVIFNDSSLQVSYKPARP
jgi:hypothetical protein